MTLKIWSTGTVSVLSNWKLLEDLSVEILLVISICLPSFKSYSCSCTVGLQADALIKSIVISNKEVGNFLDILNDTVH